MYPEVCDTAEKAARKFKGLMATRPGFWAENVCASVEELTDSTEQINFLAWCADPMGKTGNRTRDIPTRDAIQSVGFENHPDYKVTRVVEGKMPTVYVKYQPQDDEKVE